LGAAGLSVGVGAAVGLGYFRPTLALFCLTLAFAVGIWNWRWSILALVVFLPFSGIPTLLAYPNTSGAVLAKDFFFVLPAYVGFLAHRVARRQPIAFPGAPMVLLGLLTLLVLGLSLHPELPNRFVAAIGGKVWLLYVPLIFLGYHLIQSREDLRRLLTVTVLAGFIPALIGIVQAVLLYSGDSEFVYSFYGAAAEAVTQDFVEFDIAGGSLRRVSSTFTFFTQYYAFTASMVALGYAWWRGGRSGTIGPRLGLAVWLTMMVAAFLSGARSAYIMIPALVVLMVLLERGRVANSVKSVGLVIASVVAATSFLGITLGALLDHLQSLTIKQFKILYIDPLSVLVDHPLGLGTGAATNASRYAYVEDSITAEPLFQQGFESWWIKALAELGIAGLVVVVLMMALFVVRALRQHAALKDPALRAVSAALLAFVMWCLISNLKNQYTDLDPVNVYFWLFLGVLFKLRVLDEQPQRRRDAASPATAE
jgi:hypothetical protein